MQRFKGDNSCDIQVESTGWAGSCSRLPCQLCWYLSIRASTGRAPRRVHKRNRLSIIIHAHANTLQSSDLQSWCPGNKTTFNFWFHQHSHYVALFPIRWSEQKPARIWSLSRKIDKFSATKALVCQTCSPRQKAKVFIAVQMATLEGSRHRERKIVYMWPWCTGLHVKPSRSQHSSISGSAVFSGLRTHHPEHTDQQLHVVVGGRRTRERSPLADFRSI